MNLGVYCSNVGPEEGGAFTIQVDILLALLEAVKQTEHKLFVFAWQNEKLPVEVPESPQVELVSLPVSWFSKVSRKMDAGRASLNHFFSGGPQNQFASRRSLEEKLARIMGEKSIEFFFYLSPSYLTMEVPFAVVVWDLQHRLQPFFPEVYKGGMWEAREANYNMLLRRASYVVTGTEQGRREVGSFYQVPSERIRILPHPRPSFAMLQKDTGIVTKPLIDGPYFFYPAQFWTHKNHVGILESLKVLGREFGLKPRMIFTGSDHGNLAHVQQKVQELGLHDQVSILGFVDRTQLISLYKHATALVYLSFFGPENLPPLEAFGLGCPVIASNVAGAEEQLGSDAILVDPTDRRALAEAMKSLLENNDLRKNLIDKGLARADNWTAKEFATGLLEIASEFGPYRRCWH